MEGVGVGGCHGRPVGKQTHPCCPWGGPEMGIAVMLRELAKDEEVPLLGSQLCRHLWDLFLFTTLNLISSTIAAFISLSFSSFHVLLALIVSGALVPGSLSLFPPPPPPHSFSCLFISSFPFSNHLFVDDYPSVFSILVFFIVFISVI